MQPLHAAQTKHAHHKKHHKQHRHKRRQGHKPTGIKSEKEHVESQLIQVVEKSNTQLDNLFMTVKNDLLQKPKQKTLLQIDSKIHQRSKDANDLTLDEQADMMLKSKAHQMTESVSKGSEQTALPQQATETKTAAPHDETPKDVAFVVNKDTGDSILNTLMEDEETE